MAYQFIDQNQYEQLFEEWESNPNQRYDSEASYLLYSDGLFIAIDNTTGDFFTEEFASEIEAKIYLGEDKNFSRFDLEQAVKDKVNQAYQTYEQGLLKKDKTAIINSTAETVTRMETVALLSDQNYLASLDEKILYNILEYDTCPLNEIWRVTSKMDEVDLSFDCLDMVIDDAYVKKSS